MLRASRVCSAIAVFAFVAITLHAGTASAQALSGAFAGGLTLTQTTTANGKTSNGTDYFSANAVRHAGADGNDSIVRFDQQKFVFVDNKKKTYSEMTFAELTSMMSALTQTPDGKQNPEAMAAMKRMMGGGADKPITVTKQGPGEPIAGYATVKYVVSGPFDMEIWAAPELKIPPAYYDAMRSRMPANPIMDLGKMFDAFKQIDGWVMKNVTRMKMMGMNVETTTEVTSVKKGAIPPATFDVPAGYKLVSMKEK